MSITSDESDSHEEVARPSAAVERERKFRERFEAYLSKRHILDEVYKGLSADECAKLSKVCRENEKWTTPTLAYGEISYESFGELILGLPEYDVELENLTSFVDIGSGIGKVVISALQLDMFERCTGYDLLPDFFRGSNLAYRRYQTAFQSVDDAITVKFINGDGTYMHWHDHDVVFIHATCFDEPMMDRLATIARRLRPESIVITLTHKLPDEVYFDVLETKSVEVSWGTATAFVQRRNYIQDPENKDEPMQHLYTVLNREYPDL